MNEQLIKDIRERVKKANAQRADETVLSAHLDAISEVYEIDRETVDSIAKDVIAERSTKENDWDFIKFKNLLWVSTLVIIMISVIWLLYNNLQKTTVSDEPSKSEQRTAQYVKEALASLNVAKVLITENLLVTGQIPSTFREIGVNENELITKYIRRIKIDNEEGVTANFSKLIGDHYYIKLKPVNIHAAPLEWDCRSNLEQVILDEIKGCTPD